MNDSRRAGQTGPTVAAFTASARRLPTGELRNYVRFAALGDSATHGLGDPIDDGWRGWARILADAIGLDNDVSFCNLGVPGATAADVRAHQLSEAVDHRPRVASIIVGLNDTMRSTWNIEQIRADLLHCAEQLTAAGALLLTVRFHDHSQILPIPASLRRQMSLRIDALNAAYDEVYETYGGVRVDLGVLPEVYVREFWSVDRLHPSELGHRVLARAFSEQLIEHGLVFEPPRVIRTTPRPTKLSDLKWLVSKATPWLGRRARDLAPHAARSVIAQARLRLA